MNERTSELDEARWRRLADADACGEPLSRSDREILSRFTPGSAAARAEHELLQALERLGHADDEPGDEALIHATVQHVLAARRSAPPPTEVPEPGRSRMRWGIAGLAVAAAVALAWWGAKILAPGGEPSAVPRVAERDEPPRGEAELAPQVTGEGSRGADEAPGFVVVTGRVVDAEGTALAAADPVHGALRVESDRGCIRRGEALACFGRGARLEAASDRLEIVEGEGTIEASSWTGGALRIEVAGDHYTLTRPVTLEVAVHDLGQASVTVLEGQVERVDVEGRSYVLDAARESSPGKPLVGSRPDAKTLLARARASRSQGDRAAAIEHYEKLLRLHPRSAVAPAAMVSLGDLYLEVGKPAAALRWFERYLQRGGALAQEAHLGRIKALRALGRTRQEREAIEAFRKRYPSSRYADAPGADANEP